ncbi:MAG: hypothetical protein NTV29_15540 [Planctomycetota bacterium]|nr:hypothetical protein [Planctomycetota bacterium]
MKFIGLILMCAASSMALLLPAMGVVKFPVLDNGIATELAPASLAPASASSGTPSQTMPGNLTGQLTGLPTGSLSGNLPGNLLGQTSAAGSSDPQTTAGLLAAAQVSGQNDPAADLADSQSPNRQWLGKLPFTDIPTQRLGLGVWLLLVPILFLGLGLWTFGSSPKSVK